MVQNITYILIWIQNIATCLELKCTYFLFICLVYVSFLLALPNNQSSTLGGFIYLGELLNYAKINKLWQLGQELCNPPKNHLPPRPSSKKNHCLTILEGHFSTNPILSAIYLQGSKSNIYVHFWSETDKKICN